MALIDAALQFRQQVLRREAQAAASLVRAWGLSLKAIQREAEALARDLAEAGGTPTLNTLRRSRRFQALVEQVADEMARLAPYTEGVIKDAELAAIEQALRDVPKLVQAALPFPDQISARLLADWNRLPTEAFESMLGVLSDGTPLASLLDELGGETARGVGRTLLDGLAVGKNPKVVANELADAYGLGLDRALRISRTETLRAHRTATTASYRANANIVPQWQWVAALDSRTCIACVMQHGKVYDLEQFMPAHVNCRCTLAPVLLGGPVSGIAEGDGERWFMEQDDATQEAMLGKPLYQAWRAGQVSPGQFSRLHTDDTWGDSVQAASLKSILGDGAAEFYARAQ